MEGLFAVKNFKDVLKPDGTPKFANGDFAHDTALPQIGDLISVQADRADWGDCVLGGDTYLETTFITTKRTVTVSFMPGTDLSSIKTIGDMKSIRTKFITNVASDWSPAIMDDTGLPMEFGPLSVGNLVATFDQYKRIVTGRVETPISQHINGNHNWWRVLQAPGVSMAAISNLGARETAASPATPLPYPQFRGWFVDKTKIPAAVLQHWQDDTQARVPFLLSNVTGPQLQKFVSQRTSVAGPA